MAPLAAPGTAPGTAGSGVAGLEVKATGLQSRGGPQTRGSLRSGAVGTSGSMGPRTSGSLNGTPWRARQHREIEAMLGSLPEAIGCICEICDCGKCVHSHTCDKARRPSRAGREPFGTTHTHDMFQAHNARPRSTKRPPPTPRETDLPPMMMETNQRTDFIPREISMRKPASPPKPNYERPTAPLEGISYYTQEFQAKDLPSMPFVVGRPDQMKKSDAKFYDCTTTKEHYKHWRPVTNHMAEEAPCFTGELLYPDKDKLPISTTKQSYPGIFAARPAASKAAPGNLTIEGIHDFDTTTRNVYKGLHGMAAKKCVHQSQPVVRKGAIMGQSQTTADYPKKSIDKVLPVDPLEPTIDLKFDNSRSFDTEQRTIFRGHDAAQHPVPKSFKKVPPAYEKPDVPLNGTSVTMAEFQLKPLNEAYVPLKPAPPDCLTKDLPKFDDRTANKEHYRDWGTKLPQRLSHADYADHYKPSSARFQGETTTKSTFSAPLQTCLLRMEGILNCIETMENILFTDSQAGGQSKPLESHLVERVSTEFNQLQFYVSKCKGLPLVEKVIPRINNITQVLQQNLEGMFIEGIETGNADILTRCLRTYITIDKISDAERLFRTIVVHPYMEECVDSSNLRNSEASQIIYDKILQFPKLKCAIINDVVKAKRGSEPLRGYDFMINSVWPDIVDTLATKAPGLFSPGNPDKFFVEYNRAMEFLTQFEIQCGTVQCVERLRNHPNSKEFMSKWSLPIYFQIRLQEIAGEVEKCFDSPWVAESDSTFNLKLTHQVLRSIKHCWADGVYIKSLTHRFWKLTLQSLSRYKVWLEALANGEVVIETILEKPPKLQNPRVDAITIRKEGDSRGSPASSIRSESPVSVTMDTREPNTDELVKVMADTFLLVKEVKLYFDSEILKVIQPTDVQSSLLRASLETCYDGLIACTSLLTERISEALCAEASSQLKLVTDIPRLYRRTNREVPTKASNYIQMSMQVLTAFRSAYADSLPSDNFHSLMNVVVIRLSAQFGEMTSEVLLSVKKMEDSLKRLKRGKASNTATGSISDDNKIRIQISVDVTAMGDCITSLGLDKCKVEPFVKLVEVVQESLPQTEAA